MKFLIDANLPMTLKNWLLEKGYDAIHTRDLPKKSLTEDTDIIKIADEESRIVTSKDTDFQKHHILTNRPKRILMITTGNIVNDELLRLFERNFEIIENAFSTGSQLVELNNISIIIHE